MVCPPLYPSIQVLDLIFPLNPEDYSVSDKETGSIKVKRGSLIQDVSLGQKILSLKLLGYEKSIIDRLQVKAREDIVNFYSGIEGNIQAVVDSYIFTNALLYKVTPSGLYEHETILYYEQVSLTIISLRVDYLI